MRKIENTLKKIGEGYKFQLSVEQRVCVPAKFRKEEHTFRKHVSSGSPKVSGVKCESLSRGRLHN